MDEKYMKVQKIVNGTVIDHIPAGRALDVYRVLNLSIEKGSISILINTISAKAGRKDILKVENVELTEEEVNRIALVAPEATINIIRDGQVARKFKVEIPEKVIGIMRCPNPNCITNQKEPVTTEFHLSSRKPLRYRCIYCERETVDLVENLMV